MTKRLTAEEVAAECERLAGSSDCTLTRVAFLVAARLVREHLVPEWQDGPSGDGWYWIEGVEFPCRVYLTPPEDVPDNGAWSVSGFDDSGVGFDYRPLNSRRVCPVSPPPDAPPVESSPCGGPITAEYMTLDELLSILNKWRDIASGKTSVSFANLCYGASSLWHQSHMENFRAVDRKPRELSEWILNHDGCLKDDFPAQVLDVLKRLAANVDHAVAPPARTEAEKWASAERTAQAEIDSDPPQENQ